MSRRAHAQLSYRCQIPRKLSWNVPHPAPTAPSHPPATLMVTVMAAQGSPQQALYNCEKDLHSSERAL